MRRLRENLPTQAVSAQRRKSPGGGDDCRNPQGSSWDFLQLVHGAAHSWVHQFGVIVPEASNPARPSEPPWSHPGKKWTTKYVKSA